MGVQLQVAALQAVVAQLIGGDTIHHACWVPASDSGTGAMQAGISQQAVAKRVLQLRWLIIDEISMVSGRLLAQLADCWVIVV